jgi:hypothetical protein
MIFYNIVIFTIAAMFVPTTLRKDFFLSFVEAFTDSIQLIIDDFNAFRIRKQYEMNINAQIIYLEKFLNDKYNASGAYPAIYITDALIDDEIVYVGNPDEEEAALYLGDLWDYEAFYNVDEECFTADGKTWKSLIDGNYDLPAEGVSWTEVAINEIVHIGHSNEYPAMFSFVVHITDTHWAVISGLENEMRSYINRYKLLGTQYTFDIYTI